LLSLKQKGFLLIAITNQPDFARGKRSLDNIIDMNKKVCLSLPLDDMFCCLHDDKDNCNCRKPKPGMILEAQEKWKVDLKKSFLIGDRKGDILAGKAAGVKTIFIDYNYNEAKPTDSDFVCKSLAEAVNFIEKSNVKKGGNK
jgi:D-glycero-D-manno-heptose 1,7-bisphosphate phosphatase